MPRRAQAVLSAKMMAFVEAYIETLNPQSAAVTAGYAAHTEGYKLLRLPQVQAAIEARRMQVSAELDVTPVEVIRRMMFIAYSDPAEMIAEDGAFLPLRQIPRELRLAIAKVKVNKVDVEVERVTTKEGKATIETTTTTHYRVLEYALWDKPKMLNSLAEHLNLFSGSKLKAELDDLSIEELDRLTEANEMAAEAIRGASNSSRAKILKGVKKASEKMLAEVAAPSAPAADPPKGGNGHKANGNGKGNGHGGNGSNGNGKIH